MLTYHLSARSIPDARLFWLKHASHFAMMQDPKGFYEAIAAFLDGR